MKLSPRMQQIFDSVKGLGPVTISVAGAEDLEVLRACAHLVRDGLARPILFGRAGVVLDLCRQAGIDSSHVEIRDVQAPAEICPRAVESVRIGEAKVLVKGLVQTADLMRAALDSEKGLRTGRLLSHVAVVELPKLDRLLLVSDGGLVPHPSLLEKAQIIRNAVAVARAIGVAEPKVAVLAAVETVSENMPATVEAACLKVMAERRQIEGCVVDGPLALDNALFAEAAEHKGIRSPVAGKADVLIVPNIEAGNILVKSMTFVCGGLMAGVVVGAAAPIVLTSRADPAEAKVASLAVAIAVSMH